MEINFYEFDAIDHDQLKYAVIVARYGNEWIFVKHRERETWEIPGGRKEQHEHISETARRELIEETGAISFDIAPICVYCVERSPEDKSFGGLFFSDVHQLGPLPESEIGEVAFFAGLPSSLTYPQIQPFLFAKVRETLNVS